MFIKPIDKVENLESYFNFFKDNIIGIQQNFESPYGNKPIVYMDWTASGRLYGPIEEKITLDFGPYVANTHTETTISGTTMTRAYHNARSIIKNHVNASLDDVLITSGTGMTGAINKFQRILGLKVPENIKSHIEIDEEDRPVVFVSHMEHHSNQTSWLETIATVVVIPCNDEGLFCLEKFKELLNTYKERSLKIASVTSCSNVTGIKTPYHEIAKLIHAENGYCFVDFACSAPYIHIDMHPNEPGAYLDAIFFSPHKFLGGPGTSGVLLFNKELYKNQIPDNPGGGTVSWTNPWGEHKYIEDIEEREDGGTPGFLQTIKIALAIKLKEKMTVEKILKREKEQLAIIFNRFDKISPVTILAGNHRDRLGVISFTIKGLHHNLAVKMLNDKYGIQSRGGCSCAGTYGHYLLGIDQPTSKGIVDALQNGGCSLQKPGWIRISVHPTTTNKEIEYVCDAVETIAYNFKEYEADYRYENGTYLHFKELGKTTTALKEDWFTL